MTTATVPLVFVPGLGFRPPDALMLRVPVRHEGEGWSVSIDSVIADREGTQVAVTIYGPFKMTGDRRPQPEVDYRGFIQARDQSGALVSSEPQRVFPMSHSVSGAGTSISCTANMDALPNADAHISVLIGEPLPVTVIPITLTPVTDLALPARAMTVSDEHQGVVITAHAVARGTDTTAVLLQASLLAYDRKRFMRALGTFRDRPNKPPGVTITDETGAEVAAFAATHELSPGPQLRLIAVCGGRSPGARSATVTVAYVVLSEYLGAPLSLAVPFEGEISLGDDRAFVRVWKETAPGGRAAVGVEFTGRWLGDRRLLYAESLTVGDTYGGVGFREGMPSEPPIQTWADDPTGEATTVRLESPVLQLRGPWKLPVALP